MSITGKINNAGEWNSSCIRSRIFLRIPISSRHLHKSSDNSFGGENEFLHILLWSLIYENINCARKKKTPKSHIVIKRLSKFKGSALKPEKLLHARVSERPLPVIDCLNLVHLRHLNFEYHLQAGFLWGAAPAGCIL